MFRGNQEMEPFFGFVKVKYGNTAMISMVEKGLVGIDKANEFNNAYVCPYHRLKLVKNDWTKNLRKTGGVIWNDDSFVICLDVRKFYSDLPRIEAIVLSYTPSEMAQNQKQARFGA